MPRLSFVPLALAACLTVSAQIAAPTFDVASVKPNTTGPTALPNTFLAGGRYSGSTTLRSIITFAYQPMVTRQIVGGPPWIDSERYDIQGKSSGNPTAETLRLMLRALLADRFRLRVHLEQRETQVYALKLARSDGKLGPQLRPNPMDCSLDGPPPATAPTPGTLDCAFRIMARSSAVLGTQIEQTGHGISMRQFAASLSSLTPVGRVVVDRTGLAGGYDMQFEFSTAGVAINGVPQESTSAASIFTALQDQLGLKLEATREPVDFLLIDSVDRPTKD